VNFAATALCVASQRMLIVVFHFVKLSPETFGYTLVPFENVAKLKYLEMTVTNQYHIHERIKSTLNWRNVSSHSLQETLTSRLLS
jgi:hypothetical protein